MSEVYYVIYWLILSELFESFEYIYIASCFFNSFMN